MKSTILHTYTVMGRRGENGCSNNLVSNAFTLQRSFVSYCSLAVGAFRSPNNADMLVFNGMAWFSSRFFSSTERESPMQVASVVPPTHVSTESTESTDLY